MNFKQKLTKKLNESKHFIYFVVNNFIEDDCTYRASALTFTTLLAIVPLMSVGFSILAAFPVFDDLKGPIQDFIFANFVPATGQVVQEYLQLFTTQVSRLSPTGVIFLIITALLVLYTIERSMNKIWRINVPRHGVSAFLLYWAILSLAPLLLGLSFAASSYLFSMPLIKGYGPSLLLLASIPYLLSFAGFTFLYVVVPNCQVRIVYGAYGAVVATLLFESAKYAFAYYISRYDTYQLLYGAFATIPIFFIWIYWVWIITLLGAEITYALSVHHERRRGVPLDGFSHALLWLYHLWQAQQKGRGMSQDALINTTTQSFSVDVGEMISQFSKQKLIQTTTNGNYLLSRDLANFSLYDLLQRLPYRLPNTSQLEAITSPVAAQWHELINQADNQLEQTLSVSLEQLFRNKSSAL